MNTISGSTAAWDLLAGLPGWQLTELPRPAAPGEDRAASAPPGRPADAMYADRERRMLALASACRAGSPVAFGWVREAAGGPVRVIVGGKGMRPSGGDTAGSPGPVKLRYPSGARGRELPPGGLGAAFAALPWWVPVAVTPDALLAGEDKNAPAAGGFSPEDGLLESWDDAFGWLVLAVPAASDRHTELLSETSLSQLMAERHDSPRAQLAARRARARHEELREAASFGLWDIWLLAGAATPVEASQVAGLTAASLHPRGMPFGLRERDERGTLPVLLGGPAQAPAETPPEPGPVARDILGMYGAEDPRPGPVHHSEPPQPAATASRWTPQPQAAPEADDGFPSWTPAMASGWGQQSTWSGGAQAPSSRAPAGNGSGLTPEFPDPEPQFPCAASSRLLAALAVPPAREIPGIRLTLRPGFDVTPETAGSAGPDGDAVALGTVLDSGRASAGALSVPRSSLNRHTFVCGATGAGKSQTVRHLLESATGAGIPWLVIEPAKAEYRLMGARLPQAEVITIRPGDLDSVPAGINPLEPAAGPDGTRFPLQAHADLVRALFLAAFQADEPFPQVLAAALTRCYREAGWDMLTGEPAVPGTGYPTLADLQTAALAVVEEIGYSREITDNVRGFVSVRIGSLMGGTTGRFLHGGFPLDYGRLLAGNVVLEIEDCGDDTDKAFVTGAVLVRLTEHLRMRARAEGPSVPRLRHLTVVEEAHRLLRQPAPGEGGGPAAHAVEMFAGLLAEIRAYGEGLVIAEQIPSKLIPDVIKNTAVKIVHRLPAADDRQTVGATMNLTEDQSRYLVTLTPGEAAVFTDGMDYPVLAKMPDGTGRETGGSIRSGYIGGLVSGLSPACPADCRTAPCSLGQMAAAQRTLDGDRVIALWAELAAAAHLAGWPAPSPGDALRGRLAAMDRRTRDCALARAVDAAVAARIPAFSARVASTALAAHLADAMRGMLDGGRACDRDEPRWLAPAVEAGVTGVPGLRDTPPLSLAVFGSRSPSLFETLAKSWRNDRSFAGYLSRALAGFADGTTYATQIADAAAT